MKKEMNGNDFAIAKVWLSGESGCCVCAQELQLQKDTGNERVIKKFYPHALLDEDLCLLIAKFSSW